MATGKAEAWGGVGLRVSSRGLLGGEEVTTGDAIKSQCTMDSNRRTKLDTSGAWRHHGENTRSGREKGAEGNQGSGCVVRRASCSQAGWAGRGGTKVADDVASLD